MALRELKVCLLGVSDCLDTHFCRLSCALNSVGGIKRRVGSPVRPVKWLFTSCNVEQPAA